MTPQHSTSVLIVSSSAMAAEDTTLLGTGGWLPPEDREALDWLTLIRFMGWAGRLIHPNRLTRSVLESENFQYLILTGAPDSIEKTIMHLLLEKVNAHPCLLISRAGREQSSFSVLSRITRNDQLISGQHLRWSGPGESKTWQRRTTSAMYGLQHDDKETAAWATLNGHPVIAGRKWGRGRIAVLSFHPSEARDREGCFSALLKHLLVGGANFPVAWYDWSGTVVLRMDDPGSAQTVHHELYRNKKLETEEWKAVGKILEKYRARLSVGYVPGWVDDGDPQRGQLSIGGKPAVRQAGKVHLSRLVKYETAGAPPVIYNYESEYSGIQQLRDAGIVEVELHGHTHMHPDRTGWAAAADRYSSKSWYREFSRNAVDYLQQHPEEEHPLRAGLKAFIRTFQVTPSTLICPGDEFTDDVLELARQEGLEMLSSYYQCIRIGHRFCWAQHVCAPYLDKPDPAWFDSGLPVIGYFHDFDLARHGVDWLDHCLSGWKKAGAKYFISLRDMAGSLQRLLSFENKANQVQLPGYTGEERFPLGCPEIRVKQMEHNFPSAGF